MPTFKTFAGNPERAHILDGVRRIREGVDPKPKTLGRHEGFGAVMLSIPEFDYPFIRAMFPDIASQDAEIKTKAWKKFARSPLSEPYRINRIKRGPQCRSITAR